MESVVAYLGHHDATYGQHMPNSTDSYLYLKNKKVRLHLLTGILLHNIHLINDKTQDQSETTMTQQ